MATRSAAHSVAAAVGLCGAIACALGTNPGDGSTRVTLAFRGALVFLAVSLGALLLVVKPPRQLFGSVLVVLAAAFALGSAFGVGYVPPSTLPATAPLDALGFPALVAAVVQVAALAVAAFQHRREDQTTGGGER